ncbi:MAG TPA: host-nuclease inhibitor Gam family protein [Dissulfurispiraceae bacterium]|nr:host-nuclease inhibitor Gam family protein [Dissulfurispiraceae bacterium]
MNEQTNETTYEIEAISKTEIVDGYIVDVETGEILGVDGREEFRVTDGASAEWVLEKMAYEDAAVLALEAREKAILENIRAIRQKHDNRRKFLEYRFGEELAAFAKAALAGGKTKTWKCPFGQVSFRNVPAKIVVDDNDLAIDYLEEVGELEAVKIVRSVLTSKLSPERREVLMAGEIHIPGLHVEPAIENKVSIKTGVV